MHAFRKSLIVGLLTLSTLTVPVMGLAHGNHGPRHGGVVDNDRMTTLELVVGKDKVEVFVLYEEDPLSTKGMKGTVKITVPGGQPKTFNLVPDGANRLVAKGARAPKGSTAEVTVTGGYDSPAIGFFRVK